MEWLDLGVCRALWHEGGERTAVVLPGASGGAFQAPVFYLSLALQDVGFSVLTVHDEFDGEERTLVNAEAAFARREPALLAAKSRGSRAAALRPELPAIWLTPLLDHLGVVASLRARTGPQLLVGGSVDPTWRPEVARRLPGELLLLDGADHRLGVEGDAVASIAMLQRAIERARDFAAKLCS